MCILPQMPHPQGERPHTTPAEGLGPPSHSLSPVLILSAARMTHIFLSGLLIPCLVLKVSCLRVETLPTCSLGTPVPRAGRRTQQELECQVGGGWLLAAGIKGWLDGDGWKDVNRERRNYGWMGDGVTGKPGRMARQRAGRTSERGDEWTEEQVDGRIKR